MQKLLIITMALLIAPVSMSEACSRVSEMEMKSMSKNELDNLITSYQRELRKEIKSTYTQRQSNRYYVNEKQDVCQEEIAKIEQFRVKMFGKFNVER